MANHREHDDTLDEDVRARGSDASILGKVFGALVVLALLTVGIGFLDIDGFIVPGTIRGAGGESFTLTATLAVAEAALIGVFFMRLKDGARFDGLVMMTGLLVAGVLLLYTVADGYHRTHEDRFQGAATNPTTGEHAPGGLAGIGGPCHVAANCLSSACQGASAGQAGQCVTYSAR